MFYPQKCIGCGKCFDTCALGCHTIEYEDYGEDKNNESKGITHKLDRKYCVVCEKCAENCNSGALAVAGRWYTVGEVMKIVAADLPFYKNSGGGLTCSGGEPLIQSEFVLELFIAARGLGIHTALDTAGNVDYSVFERVLQSADLVLFDMKCMDEKIHEKVTGTSNRSILENLKRIGKGSIPVWIRIPVIPGVNDNQDNMEAVAEFLKPLAAVEKVEMLPYHNLGMGKYENLGISVDAEILKIPDKNVMKKLAGVFENNHYEVKAGDL